MTEGQDAGRHPCRSRSQPAGRGCRRPVLPRRRRKAETPMAAPVPASAPGAPGSLGRAGGTGWPSPGPMRGDGAESPGPAQPRLAAPGAGSAGAQAGSPESAQATVDDEQRAASRSARSRARVDLDPDGGYGARRRWPGRAGGGRAVRPGRRPEAGGRPARPAPAAWSRCRCCSIRQAWPRPGPSA